MFLWLGYGGWTGRRGPAVARATGLVADFGWKFRPPTSPGSPHRCRPQLLAVPAIYLPILFLFIGEQDVSEAARELTDRATPLGGVLLVLVVVVGAPVVEELFFRGLLLRGSNAVGRWPAVIISSIVFGLVHFQLVQFPALVMFGLLAGWLTVRSGSPRPAIWAHVGFNGVTVACCWSPDGLTAACHRHDPPVVRTAARSKAGRTRWRTT
jgi:uncharacterized protein